MDKHRDMEVWIAGIFDGWEYLGEKGRKWAGIERVWGLRKKELRA